VRARIVAATNNLIAIRDEQARDWAALLARLDAAAAIDASGRDRDALIVHLNKAADLEYDLTGGCDVVGVLLEAVAGDS
jgi:hypothetical protein